MCMDDAVRIESKDVPEYAYKVYYSNEMHGYSKLPNTILRTYFKLKYHSKNKFNGSESHKKHTSIYDLLTGNGDRLHFGRISVFINKKDAIEFCRDRRINSYKPESIQVWKVKIRQTTKYAYKGLFADWKTMVVDQVKPIEQVI